MAFLESENKIENPEYNLKFLHELILGYFSSAISNYSSHLLFSPDAKAFLWLLNSPNSFLLCPSYSL